MRTLIFVSSVIGLAIWWVVISVWFVRAERLRYRRRRQELDDALARVTTLHDVLRAERENRSRRAGPGQRPRVDPFNINGRRN